ncbi:hypothetical protein HYFRA_00001227 [Hymenoscyphus fraxineus]|uniref:Uncharacterized protein n=1 Tax=Hymenoscyphus fraxineus TaxID=746836 RepID=A0A9N9KQY1_9HELO|nr:hypothetical protein HYFRA_00001227 [Hymenoscyphus fraxineus]
MASRSPAIANLLNPSNPPPNPPPTPPKRQPPPNRRLPKAPKAEGPASPILINITVEGYDEPEMHAWMEVNSIILHAQPPALQNLVMERVGFRVRQFMNTLGMRLAELVWKLVTHNIVIVDMFGRYMRGRNQLEIRFPMRVISEAEVSNRLRTIMVNRGRLSVRVRLVGIAGAVGGAVGSAGGNGGAVAGGSGAQ